MKIINPESKWKNVKIRKIHPDTAILLTKQHKNAFYKSLKLGYKYTQTNLHKEVNKYILYTYSLLNAMYENDRVILSTSLNTLNNIIENDKNIKEKQRLTRDDYKVFLSFISKEKIFKILNPERRGKEALILELTDSDFLPFFLEGKSRGYVEEQKMEAFNFIDRLKKEEEGLVSEEEENLFDFLEGTNLDPSLKSIKNNKNFKSSLEHRTQNLEHTTLSLENTNKKIDPTTSSFRTQNALKNDNDINCNLNSIKEGEEDKIIFEKEREKLEDKGEEKNNNYQEGNIEGDDAGNIDNIDTSKMSHEEFLLYLEKNKDKIINPTNSLKESDPNVPVIDADVEIMSPVAELLPKIKNKKKVKFEYLMGLVEVEVKVRNGDVVSNRDRIIQSLLSSLGFQIGLCNKLNDGHTINLQKLKQQVNTFFDCIDPNYDPFKEVNEALKAAGHDIDVEKLLEMASSKTDGQKVNISENLESNVKSKPVTTEPSAKSSAPAVKTEKEIEEELRQHFCQKNDGWDDAFASLFGLTHNQPATDTNCNDHQNTPLTVKEEATSKNAAKQDSPKHYNTLTDNIPKNVTVGAINDKNKAVENYLKDLMKNDFYNLKHLEFFVEIWDLLNLEKFDKEHQPFLVNRIDKLAEYVFDSTQKCGLTITEKVRRLVDFVAVLGPIFPCDYLISVIEGIFERFTKSSAHAKILDVYRQEIKVQYTKNMGTYRKKISDKSRGQS